MLTRESYTAQEVNEIIENIAVGISSGSGEVFFEKLVLHLWKLYKMKFIFVGLLNEKEDSVSTLKFCIDGKIADNFDYALEHTPCEKVIGQASASYPSDVRKTFAEDLFFQKNSIESYIGIRLLDREDKGIGLIGCLDTKKIDSPDMMKSILEIFAFRASGELERMRTEEELERRVLKRTQELQNALELIKEQSHTQLLESEKMASLGTMVAGFTHDLNTPIGLSITGVSYILGENKKLIQEMEEGRLSKNSLQNYLEDSSKMADSMSKSLDKAKELVRSFKLISIDQHLNDEKSIYLKNYLNDILLSLHFKLKHTQISIINNIPVDLEIAARPGVFFQIFENLIMNSIIHAFNEGEEGRIEIEAACHGDVLMIKYRDNGRGMNENTKKHIFDQFYTTRKEEGGTGLGMYILYDLVVKQGDGKITINSEPGRGSEFILEMKI